MVILTQLFPIAGAAGTWITVRGVGFLPGAPASHQVRVGGIDAAAIVVVATGELRAQVPALPTTGPADVAVSADAGATWGTLAKAFYLTAGSPVTRADHLVQGGARAVFIDGRPVGFTDAPIRLAHEVAYTEAEVQQELGAVKLFPAGERWRLTVPLAEISLDNLCLALGGALTDDADGMRTLAVGGGAGAEHAVLVQGPGVAGTLRDFYAYRAVVETHEPLVIARESPQRLALTLRLLPELSLPVGQRVLRIAEGTA